MANGVGFKSDKKSVLLSLYEFNYLIDVVKNDSFDTFESSRISREKLVAYLEKVRDDKFF